MKIRIVAAEEDPLIKNLLLLAIKESKLLELVDVASNGCNTIDKLKHLKPNVIIMSTEMSVINSIEAVSTIMKETPVPIIMLAPPSYTGARQTISALDNGAIDFVRKPRHGSAVEERAFQYELMEKIKIAAKVKYIRWQPRLPAYGNDALKSNWNRRISTEQIVAMGASTGGPRVLAEILSALPSSFVYPILIVQHMPALFTTALAEHLNNISSLRVKEASHGDEVLNGHVYVAPGGCHMTVVEHEGRYRIALQPHEQLQGSRAPIDTLFASVSKLRALKCHYVVLTGAGTDGDQQLPKVKQAGAASIIAQDKMKCAVFEMPRAAIETGAVDYIVPLERISDKLVELTSRWIV